MKMSKAREIINGVPQGFMVSFYHKEGCTVRGDHFPDKHAGEPLIPSEEEAWTLARLFAERTVGKCVDIYVMDHEFHRVPGWKARMIVNRTATPPPKRIGEEAIRRLAAFIGREPDDVRDPDTITQMGVARWHSAVGADIYLAVTDNSILLISAVNGNGVMVLDSPSGAALARGFLEATKTQE